MAETRVDPVPAGLFFLVLDDWEHPPGWDLTVLTVPPQPGCGPTAAAFPAGDAVQWFKASRKVSRHLIPFWVEGPRLPAYLARLAAAGVTHVRIDPGGAAEDQAIGG